MVDYKSLKKDRYWAYNRLTHHGKPVGRAYVTGAGNDRDKLESKVKRDNTRWNKFAANKKEGYRARLEKIVDHKAKIKSQRTKSRNSSDPYGFMPKIKRWY